jgi:hypothetical protein
MMCLAPSGWRRSSASRRDVLALVHADARAEEADPEREEERDLLAPAPTLGDVAQAEPHEDRCCDRHRGEPLLEALRLLADLGVGVGRERREAQHERERARGDRDHQPTGAAEDRRRDHGQDQRGARHREERLAAPALGGAPAEPQERQREHDRERWRDRVVEHRARRFVLHASEAREQLSDLGVRRHEPSLHDVREGPERRQREEPRHDRLLDPEDTVVDRLQQGLGLGRPACLVHRAGLSPHASPRINVPTGPASAGEGPHESREEIATAGKWGWGRRSDTARRRSCAEHGENPARSIREANGAGGGPAASGAGAPRAARAKRVAGSPRARHSVPARGVRSPGGARVCGGPHAREEIDSGQAGLGPRAQHAKRVEQDGAPRCGGGAAPVTREIATSGAGAPRAARAKRMEPEGVPRQWGRGRTEGAAPVTRGNRDSGQVGLGPHAQHSRSEWSRRGSRVCGGGAAWPLQLEMKAPPHAGHRDCCSLPGLAGLTGQRWRGRKSVTSRGA